MTSYILQQKKKNQPWIQTINHNIHHATPPPSYLAAKVFVQYIYCVYHMILMSEKMTSQNKLYKITSVPYNKPINTVLL